jgi:sulfur transfer protein SufE
MRSLMLVVLIAATTACEKKSVQEEWEDVIAVPPDFYSGMGLQEVVSALRLRGMGAILARLKRQIRETMEAGEGQ